MRKLLLTFLCLFGFIAAWAAESTVTVDFPKENPTWPKSSAYTGTTTSNDGNWTITNANNNNNGWGYVKIGGKKTDDFDGHTISALTSVKQLGIAVKTVAVNVQKLGATSVVINSIFVEVSADATFPEASTTKVTATLPSSYNNTDVTMTIAEPKANCYYRVTIDVNNPTTTNGAVWVNSYSFTGEAPANMTEAPTFEGFTGATAEYWDALNVKMNVPEGATVYYTTDNTTPTTSSTVYTAAGIDVPAATTAGETFVIKAIAVADGKEPSAIVTLTLTAVKTYVYNQLSAITAGTPFAFVAVKDGKTYVGKTFASNYSYGYMNAEEVTPVNGVINVSADNLFVLENAATEGKFYLKEQASGRYLYQKRTYTSFNLGTNPDTSYEWTVASAEDGTFTLTCNSYSILFGEGGHNTFGVYSADDDPQNAVAPCLYGEKADVPVVKQPAGLEFSAATAEATIGEAFTAPTLTFATTAAISYTSSTPAVATVDAATGAVTPLTEGTTTIMATSAANDDFEAGSAQYVLTVKAASTPVDPEQPEAPKPAGLAFSAATAKAVMGQTFTAPVLVKATDAAVSYNSSNSSVAVINGTDGALVLVAPGTTIITATTPANDKYLAGSAQYSLTVEAAPTPDQPVVREEPVMYFTPGVVEAEVGKAFTAPVLTKPEGVEVLYTSNNTDAVVVDALSGAVTLMGPGNAMVTATSPANANYLAGSAFYLITVKGDKLPDNPDNPDQPTNVTIVYANHSADALDVTVDGINAKAEKQDGTTAPVYNESTAALRLYAKNTLTISGKEIEKIVFTLADDAKYRYTTFTPSVGAMATQAKGDTQMTWTGDASSITFTVGEKATLGEDGADKAGQIRISKIEIFVKGGGDTPTPPQPGEGYSSLAEWMQAKPAADEAINAALTVLYQNGKDLFVKQADTYGFVYGDVAQEYTNGQVIAAGATGHYEEYNGMPEIIPVASTFAKGYDGAPEAPQLITGDKVTDANLLHYVRLESAKVEATETDRQFTVTADGATFTLWNRWSKTVTNVAAADDADIYGFIGKTKIGDNIEVVLFPTRFEDNGGTPVNPGDNTATFDFTQPGSLSPAQSMPGAGADNAVDVNGVTFTSGVITLVNDKGTNNTSPRLYKSKEESEVELRVYNGGSTTISSTNGASITRIEFVTAYPANYDNSNADSGSLADAVWTGDATSVTFSWAKDSQGKYSPSMQKVIVTYGEGGEPGPVQPTEETATYNFQDPTTLSDPFEAPASGEGIELDGRTFTAGKTSITLSRGTNDKNAPRVFTSSKNVTDLRFYGDNTATIAGTGVTLKRIEFVCQYTSNFENSTASTGTLTDNIWTGEAASVDFHFLKSNPNSSGTTFNPSCTSIKVTYVTSSGIEEVVTIDTTPVEYYNLQGVRLEEPAPGQIVIRRQGNKVEKILVK
jgi:hypothetical protein